MIISKSTSSKSSNITPKRLDFSQRDQADIFQGHFLYVVQSTWLDFKYTWVNHNDKKQGDTETLCCFLLLSALAGGKPGWKKEIQKHKKKTYLICFSIAAVLKVSEAGILKDSVFLQMITLKSIDLLVLIKVYNSKFLAV